MSKGFRLPSLTGAALGSLSATLVGQLSTLVSGVLTARILGPEDRGYVALIAVVTTVISGVVPLGLPGAVTYFLARDRRTAHAILEKLRTTVAWQIALVMLLQILVVSTIFSDASRDVQVAGLIGSAIGPVLLIQSYAIKAVQGYRLYRPYNILRSLPSVSYSMGVVLIVPLGGLNVLTTVIIWGVANVLSACAIYWFLVGQIKEDSDAGPTKAPQLKEMAIFGAKGFLGTASPLETFKIDQMMIGAYLNTTALGVYNASTAFTTFPRVIAQSMALVALPHIASQSEESLARRAMWGFFSVTMFMSVGIALVLVILAPWLIPFLFGEDYRDSVLPAQILLAASVAFGGKRILSESLRAMNDAAAGAWAEVASWVVLLAGLTLLVPRWGLTGVAIATVFTGGVSFLILLLRALSVTRRRSLASHRSEIVGV